MITILFQALFYIFVCCQHYQFVAMSNQLQCVWEYFVLVNLMLLIVMQDSITMGKHARMHVLITNQDACFPSMDM